MKYVTKFILTIVLALAGSHVEAAVKYWDIDGATAGAGGATPAGTWNTSTANWTTDSTGSSAGTTWAAGDSAIFSAGTDASGAFVVTVSGTQTGVGIGIEEGTVSIAGGTITNGASPFAITIAAGTTLSTDSSLRIRIGTTTPGSTLTITDGTLRTTNPGAAGTFMDEDLAITLNGSCTFSHTTANILNIVQSGTTVSGPGSLTKTGAGVLAFAGACTYSGGTTITEGELRIRTTANRLPTGTDVTVSSPGILNLNAVAQQIGSLTGNGEVGLAGATLTIGGTNSPAPYTGRITTTANAGAGGSTATGGNVTKQGAGTLTLAGLNNFTGLLTMTAGGINVTDTGALCDPVCDLLINGGTLSLTNTAQGIENLGGTGGTIILNSGHTLTIDPANANRSSTYSGAIVGAGGIVKINTRTQSILGANTYTGPTTVSVGKLITSTASAGGGSFSVADGAALGVKYNGGNSNLPMSSLTIGNSTAEFDLAGLAFPSGAIVNDAGTIDVNGTVTVDLKGLNTTGSLTLLEHAGTRNGAGAFALGTLPPHTAGEFTDDIPNKKVLLNVTNADTLVWVSDALGVWDVNNGANQIWKLTPANVAGDYQENAMQGDTVRFDDTATGTAAVNISAPVAPYKMTVDNTTTNYSFSGAGKITGLTGLTKNGTGELTLSTSNDFTGGTAFNAGTLGIGSVSALGLGKLTINGSTIRSDSATARTVAVPADLNANIILGDSVNNGDLTFSGAWTITASRQINVDTINATISGAIGDGGSGFGLTKNGNGTLSLTPANTFSGGVVHNAGTLRVNNNASLGVAGSPVTLANGVTLGVTALANRTLNYNWTINGDFTLGQSSQAGIVMAGSINLGGVRTITTVYTNHTLSGIVTNGGIVKEGTGTLTISGTTNTYAGATRVNAGILSINGTATLGSGALIFGGGNMIQSANRAAGATLPNDIELLADAEIRGDTTGTGTRAARFSGRLIGSAGSDLTIANAGTVAGILDLILSGGDYTFSNNVVIGVGSETGGAQLSLFNLNTTNPVVYSGEISGYGTLRKSASTSGTGGTAILTGANTYSGGTAVNDGTLLVNNTSGSGTGSGTVTVTSGGVLGGTGTVSGSVVLTSSGNINAGASAGILTLGNGLDLSAGGTNVWELAANSTNTAGTDFDQISLTGGNLVLGGTSQLQVKFIGSATFPDSGNSFWQIARSWLIIAGSGTAANPGSTTFASVDGVAGNNAGSFSTSSDANGNVYLNFTPGVVPPPPVIDPTIVGAGTTSAQLSWSSVAGASYTVEYKTNLNQVGWLTLTNLMATGTTTTIVDNTSPVPVERYYRVISP